jgi:hypothetical protein
MPESPPDLAWSWANCVQVERSVVRSSALGLRPCQVPCLL